MASLIVPVEASMKERMEEFGWVNWSYVAQEACMKRRIFEDYMRTGEVSDEDNIFCDKQDWHPVDWLPLKKEFIKKIKAAKKEKSIPLKSVSEVFD